MARSLNFTDSSSQYIARAHNVVSGTTFTVAVWIKRSGAGTQKNIWTQSNQTSNQTESHLYIDSSNRVCCDMVSVNAFVGTLISTNTVDENWHHVCLSVDTMQATTNDRGRLYLDGAEVNYDTRTLPNQNALVIASYQAVWGVRDGFEEHYFNGKLDDCYFIDGSQYDSSYFITGINGGPKTFTGIYGSNGYHLDFENNTNTTTLGHDTSGNNNHFGLINLTISDSSTDFPAIGLATVDLTINAPVLSVPANFYLFPPPVDLFVGSPALTTPILLRQWEIPFGFEFIGGRPMLGTPHFLNYKTVSITPQWFKSSAARIGGYFMDVIGTYDAIALLDSSATTGPFELSQTITIGDTDRIWRISFEVRPSSDKLIEIGIADSGGSNKAWAVFNPDNGERLIEGSTGIFHLLGVEADPIRFGYIRFVLLIDCQLVATLRGYIRLVNDVFSATYVGDGTGSIIIGTPSMWAGVDARQHRWEIGEPEIRFFWTVHVGNRGLRWFRAGEGEAGVDHHLTINTAEDLECVLQRWKPAHTTLIFDYTTLMLGGGGDPMEGTP